MKKITINTLLFIVLYGIVSSVNAFTFEVKNFKYINPYGAAGDGKYLRAGIGENSALGLSNSNIPSTWESFVVHQLGNNKIAIRSMPSGKYLSVGTDKRIYATATGVGSRETFTKVIGTNSKSYSLKWKRNIWMPGIPIVVSPRSAYLLELKADAQIYSYFDEEANSMEVDSVVLESVDYEMFLRVDDSTG